MRALDQIRAAYCKPTYVERIDPLVRAVEEANKAAGWPVYEVHHG